MLGDADFQQAMKNTREFVVQDYPFYHLNPGFKQGIGRINLGNYLKLILI